MASIMASIEKAGKVAPQAEKPSTAHNEQILIDIRKDGISPKANAPNPCAASMVNTPSNSIIPMPPGWGKLR